MITEIGSMAAQKVSAGSRRWRGSPGARTPARSANGPGRWDAPANRVPRPRPPVRSRAANRSARGSRTRTGRPAGRGTDRAAAGCGVRDRARTAPGVEVDAVAEQVARDHGAGPRLEQDQPP